MPKTTPTPKKTAATAKKPKASKKAVEIQLTSEHIPESKYYGGDKFARTLEEAFGPGAEWPVDRRSFIDKHFWRIAGGMIVLIVASVWYGLTRV